MSIEVRCTLGVKRQTRVTEALSEMVTAMLVTRSGTWLAVPKYSGTNDSQITHVVYIVKPDGRWSWSTLMSPPRKTGLFSNNGKT